MISESKRREILSAFGAYLGRANQEQIETYSLKELLDAEAMLGDWDLNASYRVAIKDRIVELENREEEKQGDAFGLWVKAIGYFLVSGLVVGFLKKAGAYIFNLF